MVTLAEAARSRSSAPATLATGRASMLRMGLPGRLGIAGGAMILLWAAIALGLS